MKKLEVWKVYLEDSHDVYTVHVPAQSKKEAEDYVRGNGDIIKTVKVEVPIDTGHLITALKANGFGEVEADVIYRTVLKALKGAY